jgi:hypothetical protein
VSVERFSKALKGEVPEADGVVTTGTGEVAAVGREGNSKDGIRVGGERGAGAGDGSNMEGRLRFKGDRYNALNAGAKRAQMRPDSGGELSASKMESILRGPCSLGSEHAPHQLLQLC